MGNETPKVEIVSIEEGVVDSQAPETEEMVWVNDAEIGRYEVRRGIGKILVCTGFTDGGKAIFTNTEV